MVRMSEEDLASIQKKARYSQQPNGVKRWQALGRLPKDKMNGTERAFADWLEAQKLAGNVIDYKFHPMNVRLAKNAYYEVDFLALMADMRLTIFEVKGGFCSEKGALKIKTCAEVLPYFRMVKATKLAKKDGGGFRFETFNE